MLNICALCVLSAFRGPAVLEFAAGTVSPCVLPKCVGLDTELNCNGKRPISFFLEPQAGSGVSRKTGRTHVYERMFS